MCQRSGGSPRLCFAPQVRALARLVGEGHLPADCRPAAEGLGGSPRLCFAPQVRALARFVGEGRLPADCRPAAERSGGSPRLCFAPQVRALARFVGEGRLPADCRPAAGGLPIQSPAGLVPHVPLRPVSDPARNGSMTGGWDRCPADAARLHAVASRGRDHPRRPLPVHLSSRR